MAQDLGAKIVGLGAFTSIVGDAGITIAKNVDIAVTSGNSYTVATALQGTREAVRLMGKDLATAHVAIIGAMVLSVRLAPDSGKRKPMILRW